MLQTTNKLKKIKGDASFRSFYRKLSSNKKSIIVYGSLQCPHCVNFKAKLDSIGLEYTFYDVDVSDQYALEMVARVKASGHTEGISIPVVVVNDQQLFIAPHISKVLAALD